MLRMAKSKGITLIGFICLASLMITVSLIGFRLVPAYIENYSVVDSLNKLQSKVEEMHPNSELARSSIQSTLEKMFDINYIHSVAARDVEVSREDEGYMVRVVYDVRIGLIGNISLLLHFDNHVVIQQHAT